MPQLEIEDVAIETRPGLCHRSRITQEQLLALRELLTLQDALMVSNWHVIVRSSLRLATVAIKCIGANRRAHRQ
jgi:hypothetical protein